MVGVASLWDTLKDAIAAYTGLSPAAFFTALAVAAAFYHLVSGFFLAAAPPARRAREAEGEPEPLPQPVQVGEITEEELRAYDGSDPQKPLLMAVKGQIYDVSRGRMFYGPGGPYALFAGRDASRALAKMSFEEKDITGDISGLGPFELDALQDWEFNFMGKYVKVGTVKTISVTDKSTSNTSEKGETIAQAPEVSSADCSDEQVTKPREIDASPEHGAETKGSDRAIASPPDHAAEIDASPERGAETKGSDNANSSPDHGAETKGSDSANASPDHAAEIDASPDHGAETKGSDSANASPDHGAETKGSDSANASPEHGAEIDASPDHGAETKGSDSANASPDHGSEIDALPDHGAETKGSVKISDSVNTSTDHGAETKGSDSANA